MAKKKEAEEGKESEENKGMPVKQEFFLESGVHIGTKIRTSDMREFIYRRRDDGLFVLNVHQTSDRLLAAAKLLSKYKPEEISVVASRIYSGNPATKFAKITGVNAIRGRFTPGTMTNMTYKGFTEPKLILICDPKGEREALLESAKNGVTVVAFCDSDNETKFVDLIVPINNKGKRSLALAFYILARELLMSSGKIKSYDEFPYQVRFFEEMVDLKEEKKEEEAEQKAEEKAGEETPEEKKEGEKPGAEKEEKKEEKKKTVKKTGKKKESTEEETQPEEKAEGKKEEKAKEKEK